MADRHTPLYMIGVAAQLAGVHPQTLRIYEQKGLVSPQRTSGNTRMYSQADIALSLSTSSRVRASTLRASFEFWI